MFGRTKYGAKKEEIDGIKFSSKLEANAYKFFKENNITIKELQPRFLLQEGFKYNGETIRKIEYVSDFIIEHEGDTIIIEMKGMETSDFKIKKKLFLKRYGQENQYIIAKSIKSLKEQLCS